ncbi:hypothetical protein [Flavobacterium agrisoli]|uniref:Uncharacterized protein n=1 Tax=Flavobacterium agrisoli TaxID=2793066 RepID=A0A934PM06_9FLAO|nr:hypothetical protein [Flavobacterium agrisoli]MBK0370662.1 hypothetical protein [Flavobacterium agrisoli]
MKLKIILFVLIFYTGKIWGQEKNRIDYIFKLKIEQALISRGDNFPDFRVKKDSLDKFLFALHKGYSVTDFQKYTNFSNEKISSLLSLLQNKNWLHKINNEYKPTVFIADANDGKLLYQYAKPISSKIVKAINKRLTVIKSEFQKTELSQKDDFLHWSFLILSDVLLDSWQIDNVEKQFLKQEDRPLRNGKHYYYKIDENTNSEIESFGIYGNQSQQVGDNKYISIYGNNRLNLKVTSSQNIVSKVDNEIFGEMAEIFLPDLLNILEKERPYCEKMYKKLGYDKEISFEEFFIWWYHFIYTQTTNEMHKAKMLQIPASGNFDYVIEE